MRRYPLRVRLMPLPRVLHDLFEIGKARAPAQVALQAIAGRKERRRIAWPPRRGLSSALAAPTTTADGVDHLPHRMRLTSAGVVRRRRAARSSAAKRAQVRVGQVAHVNVVAQAGAVRRRIVLAKHLQRRSPVAASIARGIRWISGS